MITFFVIMSWCRKDWGTLKQFPVVKIKEKKLNFQKCHLKAGHGYFMKNVLTNLQAGDIYIYIIIYLHVQYMLVCTQVFKMSSKKTAW